MPHSIGRQQQSKEIGKNNNFRLSSDEFSPLLHLVMPPPHNFLVFNKPKSHLLIYYVVFLFCFFFAVGTQGRSLSQLCVIRKEIKNKINKRAQNYPQNKTRKNIPPPSNIYRPISTLLYIHIEASSLWRDDRWLLLQSIYRGGTTHRHIDLYHREVCVYL